YQCVHPRRESLGPAINGWSLPPRVPPCWWIAWTIGFEGREADTLRSENAMRLGLVLLCCGLVGDAPGDADRTAYETLRAQAGRDPDAQVRLALWCEQHGLQAERMRHLGLAALADPDHAIARALQGLIKDGDRWRRPEQVAERVRSDAALAGALAEYN